MPDKLKLKKQNKMLYSFCILPEVDFNIREKDEKVVAVVRAHPITQFPWIFNSLLFLILIVILNLYVFPIFSSFLNDIRILAINFFLFSLCFSYILLNITSWFFNVGIITTKRVLDLDYHPLTYREFTGTGIENIEDITSNSVGPFSNIFRYGNVEIQTAGTEQNIEFLNVPFPDEIVKIINRLKVEHK